MARVLSYEVRSSVLFAVGGALGLVLSVLTIALLHSSRRLISWQRFFAISEAVLLMLGAALLVSGTERIGGQLLALDSPEVMYSLVGEARWDSSTLLSDSHGLGGFLAGFAGYPLVCAWRAIFDSAVLALVTLVIAEKRKAFIAQTLEQQDPAVRAPFKKGCGCGAFVPGKGA